MTTTWKNGVIVMGGWCGKMGDESRYQELHFDKLHLRGMSYSHGQYGLGQIGNPGNMC